MKPVLNAEISFATNLAWKFSPMQFIRNVSTVITTQNLGEHDRDVHHDAATCSRIGVQIHNAELGTTMNQVHFLATTGLTHFGDNSVHSETNVTVESLLHEKSSFFLRFSLRGMRFVTSQRTFLGLSPTQQIDGCSYRALSGSISGLSILCGESNQKDTPLFGNIPENLMDK